MTAEETAEELVLTGLRLTSGIDRKSFKRVSGQPLDDWLPSERIGMLAAQGLALSDARGLRLTGRGRQLLDAATSFLLAGR
ncbi:MAG TPA: hypothetical protein VKA18_08055 [Alphaproteobacteria bacterium]|nr:hypothetical protein [Alphaproteobacteria bacterium]